MAWLAENRFAAAYAWWIGLVERFAKPVQLGGRLVDDPYECIARGAISHPYRTGRIWKKWLSRRDRRRRLRWDRLNDLLTRHPLPATRIVHRYTAEMKSRLNPWRTEIAMEQAFSPPLGTLPPPRSGQRDRNLRMSSGDPMLRTDAPAPAAWRCWRRSAGPRRAGKPRRVPFSYHHSALVP